MAETWTQDEMHFLKDNIGVLTMDQIYQRFSPHRSRTSVDLKIKRMRLAKVKTVDPERVKRNLITEMLRQRIGDPRNFQPQRDFYERTKIGQKRFWQLYNGEKNPSQTEYVALTREWNVTLEDAFDIRQLKIDGLE
jgi:hypothetical protein